MALRNGKCTNYGLCVKADTREAQNIADGADFVCQECKRPLAAVGQSTGGGSSNRVLTTVMVAVVVLAVFGGVAYLVWRGASHLLSKGSTATTPSSGSSAPSSVPVNTAPMSAVTPVLRLAGSNTIGAELGPALAEAWLASKGASNIHRERGANAQETLISGTSSGQGIAIEVRAHGSATAFSNLAAGSADIGMASRKITAGEAADLQSRGMGDLTSNVNERVLGLDGVAIVVNEVNPADTMTKDEVAAVFSGAASSRDWHIYALDDKSGTYDTFKDRVLGNGSLVASAKRFEDSRALVSAVAQDRNGIGFVGLPYAVGVKVLAISERGAIPLIPNPMTVRTESYALSRRLYLYLPATAKLEAADFVRFALSPAGQDIVEKNGFVGQKVEVMTTQQAPSNSPRGYVQLMPSSDRLSVDFRFRTGSKELDTKAVDDINRVAASMNSQFAGRGVILVGFADNTGSAAGNLALSKERAQVVAEQMARHGITAALVTGFGQELPVSDNSTADGREKNRRVEVWLRK
jgi:phosphate transport system substrate-binding protein